MGLTPVVLGFGVWISGSARKPQVVYRLHVWKSGFSHISCIRSWALPELKLPIGSSTKTNPADYGGQLARARYHSHIVQKAPWPPGFWG